MLALARGLQSFGLRFTKLIVGTVVVLSTRLSNVLQAEVLESKLGANEVSTALLVFLASLSKRLQREAIVLVVIIESVSL